MSIFSNVIVTHFIAVSVGAISAWWVTFKAKVKAAEADAAADLKVAIADIKTFAANVKSKI